MSQQPVLLTHCHERCEIIGRYILANNSTVRSAAAYFSLSKSTVHKDVTERLRYMDADLFEEVRKVLNLNLSERHIRGGIATKEKYIAIAKRAKN